MVEESILINEKDYIILKKAIAKTLYNKKMDQIKISEILNLSQPMVSNYCSKNNNIPKNIQTYADEISRKIIDGSNISFNISVSYTNNALEGKFFIARKNELISQEKSEIINNLTQAFLILKDKNIKNLIPEIKINIAMSNSNPLDANDIASFQNGLIISNDMITSYNGIQFGKSKHLSTLLLYLKKKFNVNSIMNIAYSDNFNKSNYELGELTKDYKIKDNGKNFDILLHKGDFGIEPCAYILGSSAVDVSKKLLDIIEVI